MEKGGLESEYWVAVFNDVFRRCPMKNTVEKVIYNKDKKCYEMYLTSEEDCQDAMMRC